MNELVTAISTGITAFTATNLDDILILLLFFSQVNAVFRRRHIVAGQYLGFTALVFVSLPGFFGRLIFPPDWIGMLGLLPIAIGLSRWLNPDTDGEEAEAELGQSESSFLSNFLSPQTYSVAAVTVANGGDNIGIYVPLFASNTLESLAVILGVFFSLVGVWCYAAYRLIQMRAIADSLTRYGDRLVPFVLIGLGMAILVKSGTLASPTLSIISLVGCGFCLITLSRSNASEPEV
ncbi:MAG: cadmium resistance transporter [Microcoleus sp. PH2017_10_PVI_O_A]|uniref:cadmium resistance transporter n=1 Tax=unclassified Microcoleus TaxID=2642155 RepID=UPI001E0E4B5E|nr:MULTISPECIES: cadmium resistance transporter [unclassified Microcoleus]TAE80389.1 MAG: transporter [Oscillatoriales cyanobacterium]MCC3407065.1 cadmium resistance transporter [Microcoleus sp. PH2017_10_PVI_O_A]MCC3461833.1 cadmium resistance transporter [Microcoleus sp. PH2017_11_PCY_U_A]MCC3477966.1 cadmium resistance transporter [Microcoleus sp. PH2017_12_PCY_D_A]MCC3529074.1 cadmium resistance transporter [Microcoleus sp. PH2017_21_RUC_O_A]